MRFACSSLPVIKSCVLNMRGIQYNLWYLIWPVIMLDRSQSGFCRHGMVLRIFETCAVVFSKSETTRRPDSQRARDSEIPHYWMNHSTGLVIRCSGTHYIVIKIYKTIYSVFCRVITVLRSPHQALHQQNQAKVMVFLPGQH